MHLTTGEEGPTEKHPNARDPTRQWDRETEDDTPEIKIDGLSEGYK